jgi:murein DD-endopeptidase MepM/ murein hydrolase activator NlpD
MKRFFLLLALFTVTMTASALDFSPPLGPFVESSGFGEREGIGGSISGWHGGVDLVPLAIIRNKVARVPVLAAAPGRVAICYPPPGGKFRGHPVYGGMLLIDHGGGLYTRYGHLAETWVREGDSVRGGQAIGIVGSTGISTGPHLHFEVLMDPEVVLKGEVIDERPSSYPSTGKPKRDIGTHRRNTKSCKRESWDCRQRPSSTRPSATYSGTRLTFCGVILTTRVRKRK